MARRGNVTDMSRASIEHYVANRVGWLQKHRNEARTKALLAALRKTVAKSPGEAVDTWDFEFSGMPDNLRGVGSNPATEGEWAIHLAISLYALHQQSQEQDMYQVCDFDGGQYWGFGHAVKRLVFKGEDGQNEQGQMPSRFAALVTSETTEELAHYARQIVQQLRANSITVDYGRLAGQLYWYQSPMRSSRVSLEWAREFSQALGGTDSADEDVATE